ncbi:MAG: hypothetical protein WB611_27500 [Stellaceae bacterium]
MIRPPVVGAALLSAVLFSAAPAVAQQPASGGNQTAPPGRLLLQLPRSALGASPPANLRLANPKPAVDCAPAWPCRLRLFGVIGKNSGAGNNSGGVGLKGPALTW